ncbi:putative 50S ribosomal protein L14e [Polypedilum vanderplanki]|uniref:Large ribosomal subunit protein eL14 n=1 Tax=Polypedilum vanderplanki TaxID=319348 RepID=A0A9J6C2X5_POLVA|nr:putative 50S ribosomal protein L14e [Polypedilum vanderplanki]
MGFTRFVETGRIARISRGRYKGKLVAIVDVIDQNRVLIDGPLTRVPRQQYPVSHLHLTKFVVKFPFTAPTRIVKKALEDFKIKEKWSQTLWAERAKAKRLRSNLDDFERFKLRLVKRSKNRMIEPVFSKLKKEASKNGTLYGKPKKGTKPLPPKKPKVEGAKKKKKVNKKKPGSAAAKKPAKK